jgi:two-component system response regulator
MRFRPGIEAKEKFFSTLLFAHARASCFMKENAVILVVEDDDNDALLLQEAFRRAGILNPLRVLVNAQEALLYLVGEGPFMNRSLFPMPGIIFTDLQMPLSSGLELIQWIKSQTDFSQIPVVALTGSSDPEEQADAMVAGANKVLDKPVSHQALVEEVRLVCEHLLAV